ncbi:MAG TPA: NAD(P)H-dependent oxidoreductase [Lutibacter sp.]|nr:NAD(P)H-dependent oxidoreductase [Lutibacter sp.]
MNLIKSLEWRYATKRFDATKKVKQADLEFLKESVRLAASSYGLQFYKVLIIENQEIKEKLKPASYDQSQITESSHLFVFCQFDKLTDEHVADYIKLVADTQNMNINDLKGYSQLIKGSIAAKTNIEQENWNAKQTYIALGNLLAAAGELQIDACPMEGFEAAKYDEILGLKEKGLKATVIAAVGYRSPEDQTQFAKKVRKSKEDLFVTI